MFSNGMKNEGFDVKCENDATILLEGCEDGYVVAHYKEPRQMMCLWDKFQKTEQEIFAPEVNHNVSSI